MSVSVLCRLDISVSFFTWFPSSPTSIWGETLSRITCTVVSTSFDRPKEIGNKTGGSCDVGRLLVDSNVPYWMTNERSMMVCECQKIPDTSIITHRLRSARTKSGTLLLSLAASTSIDWHLWNRNTNQNPTSKSSFHCGSVEVLQAAKFRNLWVMKAIIETVLCNLWKAEYIFHS